MLDKTIKRQVIIQFNINLTSFINSMKVSTLINEIEFHVILAKTLFLLNLMDINKLSVYFNNLID
jgi:hypothetical protein